MGEMMTPVAGAVGRHRRLDGVEPEPHRTVPEGVEVHLEAGGVEHRTARTTVSGSTKSSPRLSVAWPVASR